MKSNLAMAILKSNSAMAKINNFDTHEYRVIYKYMYVCFFFRAALALHW